MRTLDFAPLYRGAVGFDRIVNMFENMERPDEGGYPPYNIEKAGDDAYRITLAVAGFGDSDLSIEVKEDQLTIAGALAEQKEGERAYLHRGIASRGFRRVWRLADHVEVVGAKLEHGLLHVDLERRVPEAKKARRIEIAGGTAEAPAIEGETVN
ncbi:MAG: Hsp20 family protein [Alphaproteobacteria bacterium]|jgi:molecular chaperone IbpA|nr:Hsp20 family protein [Alphaproteobacteria bacterium]